MSGPTPSRVFCFGLFEADLQNARLTRKGVAIRLQDQPFRVLATLLQRAGQVVTREELRRALWPAETHVDFEGNLNAALKRLRAALDDDADNPRFIETIPRHGYRFIAPLSVKTAAPDASADSRPPSPAPARPSRRWLWLATAPLALLAVLAAIALRKPAASPRGAAAAAAASLIAPRRSVAVLDFQNVSGRARDAWLAPALADMLRTELGAAGKLQVVPGGAVAQLRLASPWSPTDSLSPPTAFRIGKALDSQLLVLGSFATIGTARDDLLRVDFRLQDAATGELLYEGAESGNERQFFALVTKIGADLGARLHLPSPSGSAAASIVFTFPANPDANRLYTLGLAKLRAADVDAAKDLLLQAEQLDPRFPLVHLMLARAWQGLGYDQKSNAEIQRAYQLSSGLPETDRLRIEGAYFASRQQPDQAIGAYRALFALDPGSLDHAGQLIAALNAAGQHAQALAVVQQLRALPPPAGQDPRLDYWQALSTTEARSAAVQPLYERAAAEAQSRGQALLYAHIRLSQCVNQVYSGHPQGANAHCRQAYGIFLAAGNHLYAADALRTMGDRRGGAGDISGARSYYRRALALLAPLHEHEKTGVVLNNMAVGYENQGQVARAQALFRQAAATWTECGDREDAAAAQGNLGDILMLRGQLHAAEAQYRRARAQIEAGDPHGAAYLLYSIAGIHLDEGDVAGARRLALESLAMARRRNNTNDLAGADEVIAAVELAAGDLAAARSAALHALGIYRQRGAPVGIYEAGAALAEVSLEQGNPSDAEQQLRSSLAQFRALHLALDQMQAATDLARALLHQGRLDEARQAVASALRLAPSNPYPYLTLPATTVAARIAAARLARAPGPPDLAVLRRQLEGVLASARRLGYFQIAANARLALAQLELRTDAPAARVRLAALAADAHRHGLLLLERKAAALASPPPAP